MIVVGPSEAFHALERAAAMVDNLSFEARRRAMAAVKSTGTSPELLVRRTVHALGYRFRLHDASLPGKPDLVLKKMRLAIFVHGCYWHGHSCSRGNRIPKSNTKYWRAKIGGNVARDRRNLAGIHKQGWRTLVIWECQLRRDDLSGWLARRLAPFA